MAAAEQRTSDYASPDDQRAVLRDLSVHRRLLDVVGEGRLYVKDALGRVARAFEQAEAVKQARMAEVRAKAAWGRDQLTAADVDGLDRDELEAVIAGPTPVGYGEVLVSRKQDDVEQQRINRRIHELEKELARLETLERLRVARKTVTELEGTANGNGKPPTKAKEAKTDA
jgi:hypothetical protein